MNNKQGKISNIFRLRKKILNNNKKAIASSIINHMDGKLMINKDDIINATLNYCRENLTKSKKYENIEWKNDSEDYCITNEDFNTTIEKFRKKDTNTYDFIINSGNEYKNAYFNLCKRILTNEEIPIDFHNTMLKCYIKGKVLQMFYQIIDFCT